ncbi:MAG: AhpC/TSA family protein [Tannerella sp.]|jgi:thiol-disulfide isomerase/thioredoxin|nr:AhpC/TSA family protein [Tannerella sp.]
MKNLNMIAIFICIAALAACKGEKNNYVINGAVSDDIWNGKTVYMSDCSEDIIIDSTEVVKGKFVFEGVAGEAKVIKLTLNHLSGELILENGNIEVDLSELYRVKGTPFNDGLDEFLQKKEELVVKAREELSNIDTSFSASEVEEMQNQIVNEVFLKMDELPISYIKKHPNDALGALLFYNWMQNRMERSAEKFFEVSGLVGEYVLNFGPVKQVVEFYKKAEKTAVGNPFVDFTVENGNKDNSSVSLSDYAGKGKYVLVDFWASWCQPCRMETPVIAEVYNKYKGDKFEVVSVAVWDKRENTLAAIEEDGSTWPQILDAQTAPAELYGIQGIPHIMLIGPDGTILARDLRGDDLKNKVAEVME